MVFLCIIMFVYTVVPRLHFSKRRYVYGTKVASETFAGYFTFWNRLFRPRETTARVFTSILNGISFSAPEKSFSFHTLPLGELQIFRFFDTSSWE